MRKLTVKFEDKAAAEIGKTRQQIERQIKEAVRLAGTLAGNASGRVGRTLLGRTRKIQVDAWEGDALIGTFFGKAAPTKGQMRDVKNRLARAHRRLTQTHLVVKVREQPSKSPTRRAQNLGTVFSPKRFQIFPAWFAPLDAEYDGSKKGEVSSDSALRRAAIIVHELNHDLFKDQKLNGKKVYGEKAAKNLAKAKPRRARRSPENMEWFCLRLQDPSGKL